MDLRDGCGRDRGVVEGCEQSSERTGELGLDQCSRLGSRKRRQTVLQARQIEGDLLAEEIGAGRQELTEFDEARAELVKCRGQPLARACRSGTAPARQRAANSSRRVRLTGTAVQRKERVVPRQGQHDGDQPGEIAAEAQKPEAGAEGFRDAKPNGAQRRPP